MSKNTQNWHDARVKYFEQLSQLGRPQILNIILAMKFWNRFKFEPSMNFKGFKPCGKNLRNSPKFCLDLVFTTVNLAEHTCMQEIWVSIQVSMSWFEYKKRV
jgi:hypothetical protein